MNLPRRTKTYGEYCEAELIVRIWNIAQNIDKLDLVFDLYRTKKRASRGKSIRVSVRKKTPIYKECNVFMRDNKNKTEPFETIGSGSTSSNSLNQTIVATKQENVLSNKQEMLDELQPCNHEEAEYRLLLHAYDALRKRFRKQSIITIDTEVVVIALYLVFFLFSVFFSFHFNEVWVEFGTGQHQKCISIHEIALFLGEEFYWAIPFCFCFNWLWHSFAISRESETNCVASLGSNRDICGVCGSVY